MKSIYLKNFKGFIEEFFDLEDVNFLVGENSTGKTTLINVVNLLSSSAFWFKPQFNTNEIEFGYFDEILSKNSKEKTFQIGTERYDKISVGKVSELQPVRVLMQFKEVDSSPAIDWIRLGANDLHITILPKVNKCEISHFKKKHDNFKSWITDKTKGQKNILPLSVSDLPIPILFQLILARLNDKKDIKELLKSDVNISGLYQTNFFRNYTWLAPIRAKPKRIYESYSFKFSPEGDHIPTLLKKLLSKAEGRENLIQVLENFGRDSNLFDSISINELGAKTASPFEIMVTYNNIPVPLTNVGYGVSQILPLIVEMLSTNKETYSIQQPEVHLHPKAQSAFGSFIYWACIHEDHKFLIETHSDFAINRFRYSLHKGDHKKEIKSQVLFFERTDKGNIVTKITIDPSGSYKEELPESYTNFFIDEELKLLEL